MRKYKDWDLLESLPKDWKIDKTVGSPLCGYEFCTNGKSVLYGQKRALVRVIRKNTPRIEYEKIEIKKKEEIINSNYKFPSKEVNNLARKKFQEQLLKEIHFDLMVCEIEGWDKKEYIREIKNLINSIDISKKRKSLDIKQPSLFDNLSLHCV